MHTILHLQSDTRDFSWILSGNDNTINYVVVADVLDNDDTTAELIIKMVTIPQQIFNKSAFKLLALIILLQPTSQFF